MTNIIRFEIKQRSTHGHSNFDASNNYLGPALDTATQRTNKEHSTHKHQSHNNTEHKTQGTRRPGQAGGMHERTGRSIIVWDICDPAPTKTKSKQRLYDRTMCVFKYAKYAFILRKICGHDMCTRHMRDEDMPTHVPNFRAPGYSAILETQQSAIANTQRNSHQHKICSDAQRVCSHSARLGSPIQHGNISEERMRKSRGTNITSTPPKRADSWGGH